ncbi:MAG: DUF1735 domain-containing protein [Ferruginibacter sp.]
MKKLLVSSLSVVALAILGTGCLKDKDFEDQRYGTQVVAAKAVSFPQSRSASVLSTAVVSSASSLTIQGPWISLEAPSAQSTDTHITLEIDDAQVTAYTGAGSPLTILPTSEYSLDLNRTIMAGKTVDSVLITFPNSGNLDPNLTYGIGLKIANADNGFDVASNMRNLLLTFTVKNKYDGVYTVTPGLTSTTGGYIDYTLPAATGLLPYQIRLATAGPTSVDVQRLVNSSWDPSYLFNSGTANSYYGNFGVTLSFDPMTDVITDLHNYYGDNSKALTAVGDPSLGSGAPDYKAAGPRFRQAQLDATGINAWDDSGTTPVVDVKYVMIDAAAATFPGPRVSFDEHWEYTGPRP